MAEDEKVPLLFDEPEEDVNVIEQKPRPSLMKRMYGAIAGTFRIIVSTILAPGRYLVACFYDDDGNFSSAMPFYRIGRRFSRREKRKVAQSMLSSSNGDEKQERTRRRATRRPSGYPQSITPSTDPKKFLKREDEDDSPSKHTRSRSVSSAFDDESETSLPKRSIRIKAMSDDRRRQGHERGESYASDSSTTSEPPALTVDTIKSPTSPTSALRLTKYPRMPAPPRPLIPKRQPSYSSAPPAPGAPQKTLVIDLDETLIHSQARGGRMSTGIPVEVKLRNPVGQGGQLIGPQVPILYWVNKRPYCDEFLRKVSKWYNLVIFTASVQEYADPVIDLLELERKYFSARYYRQHCTYRNGAYIKDLSVVQPDLSKVMILDNSPLSYIFHEDNAIPIEGWISDPTDSDLLHLVPFFEGLQYSTDVRALLALRLGEATST